MKGLNCKKGEKFGFWTVIDDVVIVKRGHRYVKVRCVCGKEQIVCLSDLRAGRATGCRSCVARSRGVLIPIGTKSKHWTVISEPIYKHNTALYLCQCDCGNTRYICAHEFWNPNKCFQCVDCAAIDRGNKMILDNGGSGELGINRYDKLKRGAQSRNIEFNVSIEYLWNLYLQQNRLCAITGDSIPTIRQASLDRIDSSKGYIEGNVQWVTCRANLSKHTMTMQELYEFCRKVLNHANQQPSQPLTKLEGSETNS